MSDTAGGFATATTDDGFTISSNNESESQLHENLKESREKRPEEQPEDPKKAEKDRVSKAASELGRKGGEAAAKAREKADKGEDKQADKPEAGTEAKPKEAKAEAGDKPPDKEGDKDEDKPGHPRHDARARIQQLARERAEERQRRIELEERLARLEAERRPAAEPAKTGADDAGPPKVESFESYEDWVKAAIHYEADLIIKQQQQQGETQSREHAVAQRFQERAETFLGRLSEAEKSDPQIMTKVDPELLTLLTPTPPGMPPSASSTIADEVLLSERAPELLVYFTEHPEEVRKMAGMGSAREISRHVALIETRLGNGAEPEKVTAEERPVSRAKPPISPVQSSAQVSDEPPGDDVDFDAHARYWNAREERQRRAR